ncbi:MAG: exodeoxyribonuclease III [Micavibrio sp.]|nr:exodeoxyribonuclease III [Micavibrio sp.]|tara:strand:- start:756530 stop:757312 length:783 start_codon:yes stop_codon:yes gene_type:complete
MTDTLKIASWNVNSIKAREDHVARFCEERDIDILLMQELKGEAFPTERFEKMGYHAIVNGQKAYNGVAILSKIKPENVVSKLPANENDEQARFLACDIDDFHLINIYMPNGNPVDTEKFEYKLDWMNKLYAYLKSQREADKNFLIGGDFNVIPEAKDCYDVRDWEGDALYKLEVRKQFQRMMGLGLYDAFRIYDNKPNRYSFWDYQAGAWPQNKGIRIDHFLTSPHITDRLVACEIDSNPRGWERPSDHTPIIIEITKDA